MQATAFPAMGQPKQPIAIRPATPPACPTVDCGYRDDVAPGLARLRRMEGDGLVTVGPEWLNVTMTVRLLIRKPCMVFDRYLAARRNGPDAGRPRHSQTA